MPEPGSLDAFLGAPVVAGGFVDATVDVDVTGDGDVNDPAAPASSFASSAGTSPGFPVFHGIGSA
jgi:hypothetical protein